MFFQSQSILISRHDNKPSGGSSAAAIMKLQFGFHVHNGDWYFTHSSAAVCITKKPFFLWRIRQFQLVVVSLVVHGGARSTNVASTHKHLNSATRQTQGLIASVPTRSMDAEETFHQKRMEYVK